MGKKAQNKIRILVYGIDKLGYPLLHDQEESDWILTFEEFKTQQKFQDYDGVILFQGIFERWNDVCETWDYYRSELLKREKQLKLLIEKNGFICFLLIEPFIDTNRIKNLSYTDLAKRELNYKGFYRKNYSTEFTSLRVVRDEFTPFLKHYGSAISYFENFNDDLEIKPICYLGNDLTGFVLNNTRFFLPCLKPEKDESAMIEFFTLLTNSLVSSFKRISQELPVWANDYLFKKEEELLKEKDRLNKDLTEINDALETYKKYKKCLFYDGDLLKESIISLLEDSFGFKIDPEDKLMEDFKIVDKKGEPLVLVETKGISKGVRREFINQTDSHRERNELPADFPSILVVNTNIKTSSSIQDKYQEVAEEQIKHAVKMRVLVLRTIDLLNLLYLKEIKGIDSQKLLDIFQKECGWLKTTQEGFEILKKTKE